jgi:hypothetical protein
VVRLQAKLIGRVKSGRRTDTKRHRRCYAAIIESARKIEAHGSSVVVFVRSRFNECVKERIGTFAVPTVDVES